MKYREFLQSISSLHDLVLQEYNYLLRVKSETEPSSYYKKKLILINKIKKFIEDEFKLFSSTLDLMIKDHKNHVSIDIKKYLKKSLFEIKMYSRNFESMMYQIHQIEKFENKIRRSVTNGSQEKYIMTLRLVNNLLFSIKDIQDQLLHMKNNYLAVETAIVNIQKNLYYIDESFIKYEMRTIESLIN